MVDVKAFKLLCHVDGYVVVGPQVFVSDFILLVVDCLKIIRDKSSEASLTST